MTNQEKFEAYFADSRNLEPGSLEQYRFKTVEGYRLPELARSYRDFCAGMGAVVVQVPELVLCSEDLGCAFIKAIEAAGGKVWP